MNHDQYVQFNKQFFSECTDLTIKKNKDYSHGDDAFANFKMFPQDVLLTVVVRMGDKLRRLYKFAKTGTMDVETEGALDSCRDIANYAAIFAALVQDEPYEENDIDGFDSYPEY